MINFTIKKKTEFPGDANKPWSSNYTRKTVVQIRKISPVNILPILSKLYEKSLNVQITEYFNHHFNIFLSAVQAQYGCGN